MRQRRSPPAPSCDSPARSPWSPGSDPSGDAAIVVRPRATARRPLNAPEPRVSRADLVLLAANAVYGTSYVAIRFAVDDIGPATLAFLRLAIAGAILVPVYLAARTADSGSERQAD